MAIARPYFYRSGSSVTDEQWQATLEEWLQATQEEILTGRVNTSWSAGDTSAAKQIDSSLPATKRREMILNDLSILDPDTYPPREIFPIRRTVPRYIC